MTAELQAQLEAYSQLSAAWGAKTAKLLERCLSLAQRSNSPGATSGPARCALSLQFRSDQSWCDH